VINVKKLSRQFEASGLDFREKWGKNARTFVIFLNPHATHLKTIYSCSPEHGSSNRRPYHPRTRSREGVAGGREKKLNRDSLARLSMVFSSERAIYNNYNYEKHGGIEPYDEPP